MEEKEDIQKEHLQLRLEKLFIFTSVKRDLIGLLLENHPIRLTEAELVILVPQREEGLLMLEWVETR
ncbi:hypothetical protein D3C71_1818180 [compost metagenome]